ncbi:3',5'-cyclic AMP phosphodiesterase CpdA [Actinoplanes tereljensis]|uniref:3',5'-cyclic adenosine monophosphate phosphodiesterase CpdA n=1 Tax=Paractinoplanes tereljensis TaxID=571912 RepID=A0A919NFS9_9ACTN|nr:phosphodiesterase [Actinoplanes tereljensis]GIF17806.1 3',5'-cyclic adenosine monophosphate phosphodiesterase CpdA [Actinoplanes tereljensis]
MGIFAHVSDVHIDAGERSLQRAGRVFRYLAELPTPPDAVIVTGDLADHGAESEYERLRELVDLPVPVLWCPGNHDAREPYRKALLGEAPDARPINRAFEINGVLILMLDSSIPGRNDGLLADETIEWLAAALANQPELPTFVCFHHPPEPLGIPFIDEIRQFGTERLAALVERHPQVVALLCGHAHTPAAGVFAGRPMLVAPSITSTLMLPFETEEIFNRDLPPMIAFHLLGEDRRLTTHYRVIL